MRIPKLPCHLSVDLITHLAPSIATLLFFRPFLSLNPGVTGVLSPALLPFLTGAGGMSVFSGAGVGGALGFAVAEVRLNCDGGRGAA